ncbi:MAG: hypothetical protein ACLVJH_01360 [Faecalibacterium prausnitzii]
MIAACKAIAPTFGGINLEDITAPECFEIEETLERELRHPRLPRRPARHRHRRRSPPSSTPCAWWARRWRTSQVVLERPRRCRYCHHQDADDRWLPRTSSPCDQFGTLYKGCNSAEAQQELAGRGDQPARQTSGGLKDAHDGGRRVYRRVRPGILSPPEHGATP